MLTCLSLNTGGLGRFGNQCFSLASTLGIAVKNNQPYAFPHWRTVDNALFGNPIDDMEQFFVNPLPRIPEGLQWQDIPYHWEYRDYNLPDGNWNICSHLQDERYFKHCMPLIRETFRMKDEGPLVDAVAVHYRAGDYIDDPKAYHPRCSMEYYIQAAHSFPEGTKFVIFSDDIKHASNIFADAGWIHEQEYNDETTYIEDFRLMKRFKHFITANSSFSLFAAIIGEHPEKKIVCPARWFGEAAGGMKMEYPEGAIVI